MLTRWIEGRSWKRWDERRLRFMAFSTSSFIWSPFPDFTLSFFSALSIPHPLEQLFYTLHLKRTDFLSFTTKKILVFSNGHKIQGLYYYYEFLLTLSSWYRNYIIILSFTNKNIIFYRSSINKRYILSHLHSYPLQIIFYYQHSSSFLNIHFFLNLHISYFLSFLSLLLLNLLF